MSKSRVDLEMARARHDISEAEAALAKLRENLRGATVGGWPGEVTAARTVLGITQFSLGQLRLQLALLESNRE
jgi:hypothetical protein